MNLIATHEQRVAMGRTTVKLPFGGCASTNAAEVRHVGRLRLLLVVVGALLGLLLLFR